MARASQLAKALHARTLVRFSRRFEESIIHGYILDIGPRFFLLVLVSDGVWFNGFECFRISDISNLKPDPYATFIEAALKRRERKPKKPPVDISSIHKLMRSASRSFPLVTIHREKIEPDVCHIGRVVDIDNSRVSLLEIDPHAVWGTTPRTFKLSEITRVNFGGDYEDALHVIGGDPTLG